MADVSRTVKRLVTHLEREGARCRTLPGGGTRVYPADGSAPFSLHTSLRNATQALRLIRRRVEDAGHTWPRGL